MSTLARWRSNRLRTSEATPPWGTDTTAVHSPFFCRGELVDRQQSSSEIISASRSSRLLSKQHAWVLGGAVHSRQRWTLLHTALYVSLASLVASWLE